MEEQSQGGRAAAAKPHPIHVIVNGREKDVFQAVLTFRDVLELAFNPVPSGPNYYFEVTFMHAASTPHKGTLVEGETVTVKNGTMLNVTVTDKS